tara:strand:- start:10 stop:279 length:270 start_codon:yes stop_codon:yes gene_type:complete
MFSNSKLGSFVARRSVIVVAAIVLITVALTIVTSAVAYKLAADCPHKNGDMIVISDNLLVPPVTFVQCTFYGGIVHHPSVGYMSIKFDR